MALLVTSSNKNISKQDNKTEKGAEGNQLLEMYSNGGQGFSNYK